MGDYDGRYAILSHTWENYEVTFKEMVKVSKTKDALEANRIRSKAGYVNISKAAETAANKGYDYIWIDTCCIDKSSSAELSEAINSLFRWYKNAGVCIVYLADVRCPSNSAPRGAVTYSDDGFTDEPEPRIVEGEEFRTSRWFTRGWTLQELISPSYLVFYSMEWTEIADKRTCSKEIREITGIAWQFFDPQSLSTTCIAERMSWASKRMTTRIEDMAYCLLGLFDVTMPLLYGEGDRAFQRLQEEIAKKWDDHTLFAWEHGLNEDEKPGSFALYRGLFARFPSEFADFGRYCSDRSQSAHAQEFTSRKFTYPSTINNLGLQTKLPLIPVTKATHLDTIPPVDRMDPGNEYLALLNYRDADTSWRLAGFHITFGGCFFLASYKTTLYSPIVGPYFVDHSSWAISHPPMFFVPLSPDVLRPSQFLGSVVRAPPAGLSIVFAVWVDPASAMPLVCVYQTERAELNIV